MQTNADEIMALEQGRLLEILARTDAPLFDRAKACQRLAVVGAREAVPALAALLSDPQVAHYARFGLEPIPDAAVDEALRNAAGKLKGRLLVGVINSIGQRRDGKAVEQLSGLLKDADPEVAEAAAAALGRIGDAQAGGVLRKALSDTSGPAFGAAADAGLECAERLAAGGKRKEALALYEALSRADMPHPVRRAAARHSRQAR